MNKKYWHALDHYVEGSTVTHFPFNSFLVFEQVRVVMLSH